MFLYRSGAMPWCCTNVTLNLSSHWVYCGWVQPAGDGDVDSAISRYATIGRNASLLVTVICKLRTVSSVCPVSKLSQSWFVLTKVAVFFSTLANTTSALPVCVHVHVYTTTIWHKVRVQDYQGGVIDFSGTRVETSQVDVPATERWQRRQRILLSQAGHTPTSLGHSCGF